MTEYPFDGRLERPPTHPGALLRDTVLPELGLSVSQAARELGISRQMLHLILAEKAPVSPEMAVRLGKFCGNGPGLWLNMQTAHDLWIAEDKLKEAVETIPDRGNAAA